MFPQSYLIHLSQRWEERSSGNKLASCIASIPVSVDCLQVPNAPFKYMLCDNGWGCFKHSFVKGPGCYAFSAESAGGTLQEEGGLLRFLAVVWWIRTSGGPWPQPLTQKHCPSGTRQFQHGLFTIFLLPSPYRHFVFQASCWLWQDCLYSVLAPGVSPTVLSMLCFSQPHILPPRDTRPPWAAGSLVSHSTCTPMHCPPAVLDSPACTPKSSFLLILRQQTSPDRKSANFPAIQ